jgi:sugar-specific transcriptional regulator TrmB
VLFANNNLHFGEGIVQVCVIVIAASIVSAIRERRISKIKAVEPDDALAARLAKIESRLTDTQDVMIALSEKMDRMEEVEVSGNKEASQP